MTGGRRAMDLLDDALDVRAGGRIEIEAAARSISAELGGAHRAVEGGAQAESTVASGTPSATRYGRPNSWVRKHKVERRAVGIVADVVVDPRHIGKLLVLAGAELRQDPQLPVPERLPAASPSRSPT